MKNLDVEIREYLTDNDVSQFTVQDVASMFYVSRAFVYKVLNNLGYNSFTEFKDDKRIHNLKDQAAYGKIAFSNDDVINNFMEKLESSTHVYIVALAESTIAGEYMSRQLVNIGKRAIVIKDVLDLKSYKLLFDIDDIVIIISNIGQDIDVLKILENSDVNTFTFTQYGSYLYKESHNHIGINTNLTSLSDKFERENCTNLIIAIQIVLDKFRKQGMSK